MFAAPQNMRTAPPAHIPARSTQEIGRPRANSANGVRAATPFMKPITVNIHRRPANWSAIVPTVSSSASPPSPQYTLNPACMDPATAATMIAVLPIRDLVTIILSVDEAGGVSEFGLSASERETMVCDCSWPRTTPASRDAWSL